MKFLVEAKIKFRVDGIAKENWAGIDWIDSRGHALPTRTDPWDERWNYKSRLLGIRNIGTRELHQLVLRCRNEGSTETLFRRPGLRQRYFPFLSLGSLKTGKKVMFWIREKTNLRGGPSSRIFVEET